jgi:formylglycine-generating enzyme required for sulfatase activity
MSQYILRKNNNSYIRALTPTITYFEYSTQSDTIPTTVTANTVGDGSAGSTGNFANYNYAADWNSSNGNVTTVGTNGGPSFYGLYDQTGQVWEWNDAITGSGSTPARGVRGGSWLNTSEYIGASYRGFTGAGPSFGNGNVGFRIACGSSQTTDLFDLLTIGNAGNSNDNTGFGAVSYEYKIGKYPITNSLYCDFLNLIAATDPNGLYNTNMGSQIVGGISRSGSSGSYTYSVRTNMGNKPVVYITWTDAARFANWLHNGAGSGSTETGAYTMNGTRTDILKNPSALFWVPSEDEWYKAAYYKYQQSYSLR